jgi:hypothetical protein
LFDILIAIGSALKLLIVEFGILFGGEAEILEREMVSPKLGFELAARLVGEWLNL